ncbi:hypothetical protein Bbelb_059700 [Branchiostoma belcheri]|nr:hypothetical protein Bbelb_059700 [Branchiostoma belcheri]
MCLAGNPPTCPLCEEEDPLSRRCHSLDVTLRWSWFKEMTINYLYKVGKIRPAQHFGALQQVMRSLRTALIEMHLVIARRKSGWDVQKSQRILVIISNVKAITGTLKVRVRSHLTVNRSIGADTRLVSESSHLKVLNTTNGSVIRPERRKAGE